MRLARSIAALSVGALFVGAPAGWLLYGWRVGVGWLVLAAVGGVLAWDVDRVTRRARWAAADAQRASQRVRDARTLTKKRWLSDVTYVREPGSGAGA